MGRRTGRLLQALRHPVRLVVGVTGSPARVLGLRLLVSLGLGCSLAGTYFLAPPPAFAASSLYWSYPSLIDTASVGSLSCPSASLCVGADDLGNVLTSTDPTGGSSAWASTKVSELPELPYTAPNAFNGVSCPSPAGSLCVVVGESGIFTSTDPAGGTGAWAQVGGVGPRSEAVSCPSASLCVVANSYGEVITSTDPTGAPGEWTAADVDGTNPIISLSCASESLCVAIDGTGNVLTSTDPVGGAAAWTVAAVRPGGFSSVACPSTSFCVIVGGSGFTTSTNPTGGANAWTLQQSAGDSQLRQVSCASASLCVASALNGEVAESSDPAGGEGSWKFNEGLDGTYGLYGVACASESLCFATDGALLIGVPARELSVSLSGDGTVTSAKAACPFGCTYSGPACPRDCGERPLTAFIPARLEGISCIESALFVDGNWGTCSASLPAQDTVTLTATPAEGFEFTGWGGACSGIAGCSIAMGTDRVVSATFAITPTAMPATTAPQVPVLTRVAQTHTHWRAKSARSHSDPGKQKIPTGTTFSFDLNESASVTLSFIRKAPGRELGKTCVAPSKKNGARPHCVRELVAGKRVLLAHAGKNSVYFAGAVASHDSLRPGNYTLVLTASASGKRSIPSRIDFTIQGG
jgi:Divergent InlB B-repeat domain